MCNFVTGSLKPCRLRASVLQGFLFCENLCGIVFRTPAHSVPGVVDVLC